MLKINTFSKAGCVKFAVVLLSISAAIATAPAGTASDESARKSLSEWTLARGNPESTGATDQQVPKDLVVKWEYKADEAIESALVVADNLVFAADVMGKLYGISRVDGKEVWTHDYDTGFTAPPAFHDGHLAIGDVEGNFYFLDAKTGKLLWQAETEGEIDGSAAFFGDNVLIASQDGKLYCFAVKDGSPVWTYQTDDQIRCSPTVAGDSTFIGGCDGQLHIVDLNTGKAIGNTVPLGG
uniref:outer membrane protein assembly factor BamB family protein n=1 Tax=Novipirellula sp. TaxID=2795430 RepID=UPI003569D36F